MPPLPTASFVCVPVNVLINTPAGLYKYTAPMPPKPCGALPAGGVKAGSVTTMLPFGSTVTVLPKAVLPAGPLISSCCGLTMAYANELAKVENASRLIKEVERGCMAGPLG